MEELVSSWYNVRPVPEDYIFPPETRPGDLHVPITEVIPVIDLSEAEHDDPRPTIQKILKAAREFGFFQDVSKSCKLRTCTTGCSAHKTHLWRDFLMHLCHPLEKWQHTWPQHPIGYQESVGACSVEVKKLASRILVLISEGLGLKHGYFDDELLTGNMMLSVNHYPPCPEPSLTLGSSKHADSNLITIFLQDGVYGLQVLKEDRWVGVDPIPHAIVVNIGCLLQVISNKKLKSAEHRVVITARTSAAFFIFASEEGIVEPAKDLTNEHHPPIYKTFKYKDFLTLFLAKNGDSEAALRSFLA